MQNSFINIRPLPGRLANAYTINNAMISEFGAFIQSQNMNTKINCFELTPQYTSKKKILNLVQKHNGLPKQIQSQ